MNTVLEVSNLHVSYLGNEALNNINFNVPARKLVGIVGPNGAGKSTLLKSMLGLIPKDAGNIMIQGKKIEEMRKQIAYIPQRSNIDFDFPISVLETVTLGTYPHLRIFERAKKKEKEWALECLEKVGMQDFKDRQIGELSGGQQQRVFLARALAQRTDILFLDEPFVGIDVTSEEMIMKILKDLRDEGKTVLIVHHDLSSIENYFDEVVLLNKELVSFGAVEEVMTPEKVAYAYGSQLSFLVDLVVKPT
ncbi:metal ABC transporter ATP-binding protein [Psychrobacillus glaciei]|uniref:Metal ABC transporter ATP-binding protein n=1 Tax=Psychrobacillus glaciei TaxID=2283160 RepID=A0A5J6SSH6_9BACI|nr:metal ABC transporter ATP-binding protein [Psychrobacillus glaciei]QFG00464.1 metal ABC transporter ATP-binding protein [Psychrobacillus glaciei]